MKTKLPFTILFVLCAMLCFAQGTTQVIGEEPGISGGYEDMTTTPVYDNTAYTAGKSQWTRWDLDTYTYNSSNGRSSPKYITIGETSATSRLRSSTTGSTQIASNTQYVYQFYYKNTGNTNNLQVYLQPDGSTTLGTGTNITANNTSGAWTKVTGTVTSKTATPSDYGHFVFRFSGASSNNINIDDVSIYQGSSVDNTAPDAPANAEVGISSYASLYLNWDAPASGVDGGGYIVVYGTSDPTTAPNTNGIYAVGNTIGSGTIGYIGTNTHALITGLCKNTSYYFRVYTVDKAFNYSSAATASGTTNDLFSGDYRFNNGSGDNKWGTSLNWQTYNGTSWVTATTAPDDTTANVYISGYTVLFESNASCENLTITQQNGYGSLLFDNNTTRSLTVYGNLENAGIIRPVTTENTYGQSTIKTHTFTLRGNLTNYGSIKTATDRDGMSTTYKCMQVHLVLGGYANSTLTNKGTFDLLHDVTLNKINASNTVTLASELALTEFTVTDNPTTPVFTFTKGKLVLGVNNFMFTANTSITGESSNSYVQTNSTGKIIKKYTSTGSSFIFPVGDCTYYTPYNFTLNSGTLGSDPYIAVRVINSAEPHVTSYSDYINRYWDVSSNDITNLNAYASYIYVDNDITGTENNFLSVLWNSANGLQNAGTVNISTNTANCNELTETGNFTAAGICNYNADAGNDTTISFGDSVQIGNSPVSGYTYLWSPAEGLSSTTVANPWAKPDTTTVYTVIVTNNYGCEKTDNINITVQKLDFSWAPQQISSFDEVEFTNTSLGYTSQAKFLWKFDGCLLFDAYNNSYTACYDTTVGSMEKVYKNLYSTGSNYVTLYSLNDVGNIIDSIIKPFEINNNELGVNCDTHSVYCDYIYNGTFEYHTGVVGNINSAGEEMANVESWNKIRDVDYVCNEMEYTPSCWGTTDYFNSDYTHNGFGVPHNMSVPNNIHGNIDSHTVSDSSYVGLYTTMSYVSSVGPHAPVGYYGNYREYIIQRLHTPLHHNQYYKLEFYICLTSSSAFMNKIGALFSIDSLCQPNTPFDYRVIDNTTVPNSQFFESSNVLGPPVNQWQMLSFNFMANYDYDYITIGNFEDFSFTQQFSSTQYTNWTSPTTYVISNIAYYFIDDVSLTPLINLAVIPDDTICQGDTVCITATLSGNYHWTSTPNDPSLIGQATNSTICVTPQVTTTYHLSYSDLECDTDIVITVLPTPDIEISGIFNTCHGITTDTILNYDSSYVYTYNINHGTPVTITSNPFTVNWGNHLDGGMLYIEATNTFGCSAIDSFRVFGCCSEDFISDINFNDVTISTDTTIYNRLIYINGIVNFSGNITVNFLSSGVFLGPNAIINVNPGCIFNIDSTALVPCDTMWDGIYVYGTTANLNITNYSLLSGAKNAVVSVNGGIFQLSDTVVMYNNYRNILVRPYAGNHSGKLSKTYISCLPPLNPQWPLINAPRTLSGIELKDVHNIIIGDTTSFEYRNSFYNLDYGIIDTSSTMYVYNNRFDLIQSVNAGKGIYVLGSKLHDAKAVIGGQSHGGYSLSNYFYKCRYGINTYGVVELTATNDTTDLTIFASIYCYSNSFRHTHITFNLLQNGRYGVAIKQTNKQSDYFVNNNKISNTLIGVGVENATPLSFDTLRVTTNNINVTNPNGGRGVLFTNVKGAKGHWSDISWNSIRFTHIPSGSGPTYFGIRLQNCYASYIVSNHIFRTTAATPNDTTNANRLIGIFTSLSPTVRIGKNDIHSMGFGINNVGTEPATRIYCNLLDSCFHSIRLTNANISQQGAPGIPWDNEFTPQTPVHDRIFGSVTVWPGLAWYYQSPGVTFNIFPNNVIGTFNPISTTDTNYCSSVLMYNFDTSIVLQYIDSVSLKYFNADIDTISIETDYQNVLAAYKILDDNDWLMDLGRNMDNTLQDFYNNARSSNIGTIEKIYGYIDDGYNTEAASSNNGLSPNITSELYIKTVNGIYLNTWAENILEFSSADSSSLYDIAIQDPLSLGLGVYGARVMLGLDLDEEGNNLKIIPNSNNQEGTSELLIYPNPANNEINIYSSGKLLNAKVNLIVYNNLGLQVLNKEIIFDNDPKTISLNNLNNGIYFYKIETLSKKYSGKIVIIKE